MGPIRLAIVSTHPIQYYAPWFREMAREPAIDLRLFFLMRPDEQGLFDPFFGQNIKWDNPVLEGYAHEFVPNVSRNPSLARFWGFDNPTLGTRVAEFAPDAVLLIGYNFWSLIRFIFTWPRSSAPLIFKGDSHRLVPDRSGLRTVRRFAIGAILRRFAAVLYVGEANKRYFLEHGVDPERLFKSPHAIDSAWFLRDLDAARRDAAEWRRSLGIPDDHAVVLFAGKFEDKKRPLDLLAAFTALGRDDATLLFVGAGPLDAELREAAAGARHVRFAPFQNQSVMPRTYLAADVLVLPSFGAYETWGLAVNEAMTLGRPAIASTHVGCAEDLVSNDVTGLVFAAGNRAALQDALSRALSDRARLAQWGVAAKERVAAYNYMEATRGLLAAVDYALAARRG